MALASHLRLSAVQSILPACSELKCVKCDAALVTLPADLRSRRPQQGVQMAIAVTPSGVEGMPAQGFGAGKKSLAGVLS